MAHWYTHNAESMHKVIGKNGKKRATNIKDARERRLVPSVTTVLDVLDKPGLNNWIQRETITSALDNPMFKSESRNDYINRIKKESGAVARKARDKGNEIHDALDRYFKGEIIQKGYGTLCQMVDNALSNHFGIYHSWISEESFCSKEGYGGRVDLYHPSGVVVDFKVKEKLKNKMVYTEHLAQLSAYALGLGFFNARHANVFISWDGDIQILEHLQEDKDYGHKVFFRTLDLWKVIKRYDSSWE